MHLAGLLIRRLVVTVAMLFLFSILAFVLHGKLGGNPARYLTTSPQPLRPELEAAAHALGTDRPAIDQYLEFLRGLPHGDLGLAWTGIQRGPNGTLVGTPVRHMLRQAAGPTASLVAGGAVLLLVLAVPLALLAASRPRSWIDRTSLVFVLVGVSVPPIVVALLLQNVASEHWRLLPETGYCPLFGSSADLDTSFVNPSFRPRGSTAACGGLRDWASHLALPWLSFALVFVGLYLRVLRASLLDVLEEPYVAAVRARGASEPRILVRHALPNAALPPLTMIAMEGGTTLVLALYIETVYGIPGLGRMTARALSGVPSFDRPVLVGLAMLVVLWVMLLNAAANTVYALIDPRAERERGPALGRGAV